MPDYEAASISSFKLSDVTADGSHAVFVCEQPDGQTFAFAVPRKELTTLMALSSSALSKALKIQSKEPNTPHILPVEGWNVGEVPNTPTVVLSFRVQGGMELSFQIHRDAAGRMQETIRAMLGRAAEKH